MAAITTIYPIPIGPKGDQGDPGLVYRGEYDSGTAYAKYDVVRVGNVQWMALTGVPAGNTPAANDYWTLFFDGDAAQDAAQTAATAAEGFRDETEGFKNDAAASAATAADILTDVGTAGTDAVAAVAAQETTSIAAVAAQGVTSTGAVVTQETASIAAVNAAAANALTAGDIYLDIAAGLAATTNGQYFHVPSSLSGEYTILYRNIAGVATEIKRYPSYQAVHDLGLVLPILPAPADIFAEFSQQKYYTDGNGYSAFSEWLSSVSGTFTRAAGDHAYWDASGNLVQGSVDTPRFSHDPVTLDPVGILYEAAASNLLSYSQEPNNSQWAFSNQNVTRVNNAATGLDGGTTAGTVRETTATGQHLVWRRDASLTLTSGLFYAYQVLIKPVNITKMRIICSANMGSTVNNIDFTAVTVSAPTWNIEALANGFYRIYKTFTAASTAIPDIRFYTLDASGADSFAGNASNGWNLGGDQMEQVATSTSPPTTYIHRPNATAAARSADSLTLTLPSGVSKITYTFRDQTTQIASVSPGSYAISGLNGVEIRSLITEDLSAVGSPVTSVAGRIGDVTLVQADIAGLTTADSPTFAGLTLTGTSYTFGSATFKNQSALFQWTSGTSVARTSGDRAVLIGNGAASAATTFSNSSAIGPSAAGSATTFATSVALGDTALGSTTSISGSTAVGNEAGNTSGTVSGSNFYGNTAGKSVGGGNFVRADIYGQTALFYNAATDTVAVGNAAGYGVTGSNRVLDKSVLIGSQTGYNFTGAGTSTLNILIGYNIQPSIATISNEMNIGGALRGNMSGGYYSLSASATSVTLSGLTASLHFEASTTVRALLNLPVGVAPTSPADGDIWRTSGGLFMRDGGTTKQFTLV